MNFRKNTKPRSQEKKQEKEIVLKNLYNLFEGRERILDASESKIFSIKTKGAGILNPNDSSTALSCRSFSRKISKKSTFAIVIRIVITFANQISPGADIGYVKSVN